jgi:hypothetical protein
MHPGYIDVHRYATRALFLRTWSELDPTRPVYRGNLPTVDRWLAVIHASPLTLTEPAFFAIKEITSMTAPIIVNVAEDGTIIANDSDAAPAFRLHDTDTMEFRVKVLTTKLTKARDLARFVSSATGTKVLLVKASDEQRLVAAVEAAFASAATARADAVVPLDELPESPDDGGSRTNDVAAAGQEDTPSTEPVTQPAQGEAHMSKTTSKRSKSDKPSNNAGAATAATEKLAARVKGAAKKAAAPAKAPAKKAAAPARGPGVKQRLHDAHKAGQKGTLEQWCKRLDANESSVRTAMTDLKNPKYAIDGKALKIEKDDNGVYALKGK